MRKARLIVVVDLDEMQGTMHTVESAQEVVQNILSQRMFAYHPKVSLAPAPVFETPQPNTDETEGRDFRMSGINDIAVSTRLEADTLVQALRKVLQRRKMVTVADYLTLVGLETTRSDHDLGWGDLDELTVNEREDGYHVGLPEPVSLTEILIQRLAS